MEKKEECILAVIHRDSLFCLDGGLAVCARVFRVCQSASLVKNLRVKFAGIFLDFRRENATEAGWAVLGAARRPEQHVGTD